MVSELAIQLTKAGLDAKGGLIQDALDAELAEVREVLGLCETALAAAEPYVARDLEIAIKERRQRAKALIEKLRTDK